VRASPALAAALLLAALAGCEAPTEGEDGARPSAIPPEASCHVCGMVLAGGTPWERPDDSRWVRAEAAWYVAGHRLPGAMGPTLASFARRAEAEAFARAHGGRVLAYDEITLELLGNLPRPHQGGT